MGSLSVEDPDLGDSVEWILSDARFEVADGKLRLKAGEILDCDIASEIPLSITARDRGGLTATGDFIVQVLHEESTWVFAVLVGTKLKVTGTTGDDHLLVELGAGSPQSVRITARGTTLLQGRSSSIVFPRVTGGINLQLGDGNDDVTLQGGSPRTPPGVVTITGGAGDDFFSLWTSGATTLLNDTQGIDGLSFRFRALARGRP